MAGVGRHVSLEAVLKEQFASMLVEGARVDSAFALRAKELRSARTGEAYLTLELADRTGRIAAVWFRPTPEGTCVPVGSVVSVAGRVTTYRGVRRVSVESLRPAASWDREDLLPKGPRDTTETRRSFDSLVERVTHRDLRRVVDAVFGDPGFMGAFAVCPASQSHHHAYVGGLLDHTVSVASMAVTVAAVYEQADADLLLAGALLHDVGKVDELTYDTSVTYSDAGRLLGHVVLGERRVQGAIERLSPAMPAHRAARLSHVILAHHGELEWGAPKQPSTLEALVLHHIDNLDAKAVGFVEATTGECLAEEPWTDAANLFRRPLYAPRAAGDDRPTYPEEDAQYARTRA